MSLFTPSSVWLLALLVSRRPGVQPCFGDTLVYQSKKGRGGVRAILTLPGISPPSDKSLMSLTCLQNRAEFQGPCCRLFFLVRAPLVWRAHTRHDCTFISQHALSFRFPITQAAWKNLLERFLVDDLFVIFVRYPSVSTARPQRHILKTPVTFRILGARSFALGCVCTSGCRSQTTKHRNR